MPQHDDLRSTHAPPRLPLALLRVLLPRAERDELLADLRAEFAERDETDGGPAARRWLWWQTLRSAPLLLGWGWWRERTGFEIVVKGQRDGKEVVRRSLQREELQKVPGTFGDPVRVIQKLTHSCP